MDDAGCNNVAAIDFASQFLLPEVLSGVQAACERVGENHCIGFVESLRDLIALQIAQFGWMGCAVVVKKSCVV